MPSTGRWLGFVAIDRPDFTSLGSLAGEVYVDTASTKRQLIHRYKSCDEDRKILKILEDMVGQNDIYDLFKFNCRTFSEQNFQRFMGQISAP